MDEPGCLGHHSDALQLKEKALKFFFYMGKHRGREGAPEFGCPLEEWGTLLQVAMEAVKECPQQPTVEQNVSLEQVEELQVW